VRAHALRMTHKARASHIGSCLSVADILAVLYGRVLRVDPEQPDLPSRDRLIMSKGHAAAALYAVLAERGFFPQAWLDRYCEDDQPLAGHISHKVPGVELSTGSLGHGLSVGCGLALGGKADRDPSRVFVILSDGECDEGSIWEAALFAPHHHLDNLTAIIDFNHIQSFGRVEEVLNLAPFADKWRAFGWAVREIDGHDHEQLANAFAALPTEPGKPTVFIAQTVKGKGVSFMEDQLAWHYRSVDDHLLEQGLAEVEGRA
jgi:transketolase